MAATPQCVVPQPHSHRAWMPWFAGILMTFVLALSPKVGLAASTYWVSPTGLVTNSGADSLNCKTLAWANSNVAAGDVVMMLQGTYSTPIQPQANGTSANRITYMGAMRSPNAVVVPNIWFGRENTGGSAAWGDFCTVKWVWCQGEAGTPVYLRSDCGGCWGASNHDSLRKVKLSGSGSLLMAGSSFVCDSITADLTNSQVTSETHTATYTSTSITADFHSYGNKLINSSITITNSASTGDVKFIALLFAKQWTIANNTFNLTNSGGSSNNNYAIFFYLAVTNYCTLSDNIITCVDNGSQTGTHLAINVRDSTKWCRFLRNYMYSSGSAGTRILATNSGTQSTSCKGNLWEDNQIKIANVLGGGGVAFYWDAGARRDTLRGNVIATSASNVVLSSTGTCCSTLVSHNTLYTAGKQAASWSQSGQWTDSKVLDNIFYTQTAPTGGSGTANVVELIGSFSDASRNLYYCTAGGANSGYAIWDGSSNKSPMSYSATSNWGDPSFQSPTYSTLNAALTTLGSAARGRHWAPDGYEGAQYADGLPPAAVTDLGIETGRYDAALSWTAPGDDSLTGTGTEYVLRYGTSTINEGNWASMTNASTSSPKVAGASECVQVTGLTDCTTYYFAVKTTDEASNTSYLSNVVSRATRCTGALVVDCGSLLAKQAADGSSALGIQLPARLSLDHPAPNPIQRTSLLRFGIPASSAASSPADLSLFDITGRRVMRVFQGVLDPGWHSQTLNVAEFGVRPGAYFARLSYEGQSETRLVVIR